MKQICFSKENPYESARSQDREIFQFFNLHDLWWASKIYSQVSMGENKIFPDGKILSFYLKIPQRRGPAFTKEFLKSDTAGKKKHFLVGINKRDVERLSGLTGIPSKNLAYYDLPYIEGIYFPEEEIKKISIEIDKEKPDYIWMVIGTPKQTILANQLLKITNCGKFFCVGAGMDFLLGKKKESPQIFTKFGLEWFYRLVTDFKHSKKKVWRSFKGLGYLLNGKIKLELLG